MKVDLHPRLRKRVEKLSGADREVFLGMADQLQRELDLVQPRALILDTRPVKSSATRQLR